MSENSNRANPTPPPVDRLSGLWRRISDHKVVQWSVAYVALAYAFQHGVVLTSDAFIWPHAVQQISMLLLALGLGFVVVFAWYHGDHASRNFSHAELSILAVLLAIGSLFFYVLVRPAEQIAATQAPAVQQAGVVAARSAAASPKGAVSIAVLPFLNLSSDKEQEFFSDGMTEEITAALAKVPELRVVARTSAFEFKGKNVEVGKIGEQLHATHLIEGSVRKAGNRLRITAQLIKADDGTHIWAEDYDRDLTDIFAVQEDIARAITTSLRMPLGLKPGENLVKNRNIDPESYQQYLRARGLLQSGGRTRLAETVALLEQVVARNPDYAPAWAQLAHANFWTITFSPQRATGSVDEFRRLVDTQLSKSEAAARRAVQLDPNLAAGYLWLGPASLERGNILTVLELGSKALALDPNDPEILDWYSNNLAIVGRVKEANAMKQQVRALEPFVPEFNHFAALYLWVDGQNDAAIAILNALPNEPNVRGHLAMIYASMGRYAEAADIIEKVPAGDTGAAFAKDSARILRTAPAKAAAPESLPRLGIFEWVYLYVGAPGRALENRERAVASGYPIDLPTAFIWHPSWAPVRKTERFKTYVRALGLVDYWRAKGWPQFCHPTTGDDFECK